MVGRNSTSGTVIACYHNTGNVDGGYYVGGVAGSNSASVTACYHATGSVSGRYYIGGIVGSNSASVTDCYWSDSPDTGIGKDQGDASKTTEVDGADVTWQTAVDAMNTAIATWNDNHPDTPCNWRYELIDDNSLPTLKKKNE